MGSREVNRPRGRRTMRDEMRPVIERAIADARAAGLEGRKLLAFVREHKTYEARVTSSGRKVWLSEVAIQLGRRPPLGARRPRPETPGQGRLF